MPFQCPPWPPKWPEIVAAIEQSVRGGDWGRYHAAISTELEEKLSELFAVSRARLCCSGTAALEIALRALKIGPGDEVILAAYDFPGNFRTIELLGARPVLIDIAPESPCLDVDQLMAAAGDQVKAVVASHLFGRSAAVQRLTEACQQHDWTLIEDACQVPGMTIDGKPAGSFGDFATLSFGGSKLLTAGNGGALLAKSERMAARLGSLIDRPGDTYPLSPLQASAIVPQLARLEELNQLRRDTAQFLYSEVASSLPRWRCLSRPDPGVVPAYYKVAWMAESDLQRKRAVDLAAQRGVPLGEGFRSLSRCSDRRCRKPLATPLADRTGETAMVMDHRALLVESSQRDSLAEALISIHDASPSA